MSEVARKDFFYNILYNIIGKSKHIKIFFFTILNITFNIIIITIITIYNNFHGTL